MNITDDTRIRAAVPDHRILGQERRQGVGVLSLWQTEVWPEDKFSLTPVGARLSELLSCPVTKIDDCVGPEVEKAVAGCPALRACWKTLRFYKEEEANDAGFSKKLAGSAEIFVNDAFGTAHRAHASTAGVTGTCKTNGQVAGFLLQKELDYRRWLPRTRRDVLRHRRRLQGLSKIGVIESLLAKSDKVILGGGMIFTFYKALGKSVGASLVEDDKVELAKTLMAEAEKKGVKLLLPTDVVVADKFAADANTKVVSVDAIPDGWMGLDIGPDSAASFQKRIERVQVCHLERSDGRV